MGSGLDEIAKKSGVSRSTVSRVINNDPRVSGETRLKVQDVIQQLNYRPNLAARSLAGGLSRIIGLVIPMGVGRIFTDPYFAQLIQGVSSTCNAHDYSVMLWVAEPDFERRTIRNMIHNHLLDGVLISSMLIDDPLLEALLEGGLPFVLVGRHPTNNKVSYVDVDNAGSAFEIVSFILRQGYRKIATIAGPQQMVVGVDRLEGYRSALRTFGSPVDPAMIYVGDFSEESGYQGMLHLLNQKPDAVFAASDTMAIGALQALAEKGLKVPDDIAVAGFDDMPFATRTNPPLTTMRQPIIQVGAEATETLISKIENPGSSPQRIVIPTELVIRKSCGSKSYISTI